MRLRRWPWSRSIQIRYIGEMRQSVPGHHWRDCKPHIPSFVEGEYLTELVRTAALRVWDRTPPAERGALHRWFCLGHRTVDQTVVERFDQAVRVQAIADQWRHTKAARAMLDFMDRAGAQVCTPQAGETFIVMVVRVEDAVRLGDDPPPLLAKRRFIIACSRCGEDCWIDPLTYGEATRDPVCMRCLDPSINQALDDRLRSLGEEKS